MSTFPLFRSSSSFPLSSFLLHLSSLFSPLPFLLYPFLSFILSFILFTSIFYLMLSADSALKPTVFPVLRQHFIVQELHTCPHLHAPSQNSVFIIRKAHLIHLRCRLFSLGSLTTPLSSLFVMTLVYLSYLLLVDAMIKLSETMQARH